MCTQLADQDMEARPLWKPMHAQPLFLDARILLRTVVTVLCRAGISNPENATIPAYEGH